MSELINKLNQYRSMGDKFYPEDILVIEDVWKLLDEIERLHSIIKETREYINDNVMVYAFNNKKFPHWEFNDDNINDILEILDKENK